MDYEGIETLLGHSFKDKKLLKKALTHPSLVKDANAELRSYERLEFFGDAVLGLIIAEFLWRRFSDEAEGGLAKRHSVLVSGKMLAVIGAELNIGQYIFMTGGEEHAGGRVNKTNMENVLEALLGALYLDGGLEVATKFVSRHWFDHAVEMTDAPQDPKTQLQEWLQGNGCALPAYVVVNTEGPMHAPVFTVEVKVEGYEIVQGEGMSKKLAERDAATHLLTQIFD